MNTSQRMVEVMEIFPPKNITFLFFRIILHQCQSSYCRPNPMTLLPLLPRLPLNILRFYPYLSRRTQYIQPNDILKKNQILTRKANCSLSRFLEFVNRHLIFEKSGSKLSELQINFSIMLNAVQISSARFLALYNVGSCGLSL